MFTPMKRPTPNFKAATYVDIQKHWRRLGPIYRSTTAERIWKPCMIEYAQVRAEDNGYKYQPRECALPEGHDSCDWRCDRKGRQPAFWDFVCHNACHWMVDLSMFVAVSAWPKTPWRIVTKWATGGHSTVWDGDYQKPLLFDTNFSGIGVPPDEALSLAWPGRKLKPYTYLKAYLHKGGA